MNPAPDTTRAAVRYGMAVTIGKSGEILSRRTRYRATPYRGSKYVIFTRNTAHNQENDK